MVLKFLKELVTVGNNQRVEYMWRDEDNVHTVAIPDAKQIIKINDHGYEIISGQPAVRNKPEIIFNFIPILVNTPIYSSLSEVTKLHPINKGVVRVHRDTVTGAIIQDSIIFVSDDDGEECQ